MARVQHVFGKKLAAARQAKAMTQRELGTAIGGVSDETISRIERHEVAGMLAKHLPKMAKALGMELEEFRRDLCAAPPEVNKPPSFGIAARQGMPSGVNSSVWRAARSIP